MTFAHFVLSLICLINIAQETRQSSSTSVHQKKRLISSNLGENVTLECFYEQDQSSLMFWYKQPLGQKPMIISTHYTNKKEETFHDKNNQRFTTDKRHNTLRLKISNLEVSDAATYYCAQYNNDFTMQFSEGTTVVVKEESSFFKVSVQQSDSVKFHPGESVTLNCTADTGSCGGEPSFYWFKNSEDHHPSLIYNQSKNKDQCQRTPDNQIHTCVYKLSLNNLVESNSGTYYCALTVCGRVVFGSGTRLEFKPEDGCHSSLLVYILSGALVLTLIPLILLIILTYKRVKSSSSRSTALSAPVTEGINQSPDDLLYAASIVTSFTRSHTRRQEECVYSSVKT